MLGKLFWNHIRLSSNLLFISSSKSSSWNRYRIQTSLFQQTQSSSNREYLPLQRIKFSLNNFFSYYNLLFFKALIADILTFNNNSHFLCIHQESWITPRPWPPLIMSSLVTSTQVALFTTDIPPTGPRCPTNCHKQIYWNHFLHIWINYCTLSEKDLF